METGREISWIPLLSPVRGLRPIVPASYRFLVWEPSTGTVLFLDLALNPEKREIIGEAQGAKVIEYKCLGQL